MKIPDFTLREYIDHAQKQLRRVPRKACSFVGACSQGLICTDGAARPGIVLVPLHVVVTSKDACSRPPDIGGWIDGPFGTQTSRNDGSLVGVGISESLVRR
jgi:hypothetical protein